MIDLRHLRYFVAVAEECHFGRAAERLHMAQPPLSQAIRRLEEELGVQLLHRTTRRVELSDAGAAYLSRARAILAEVDEAGSVARRVAAGAIGHLTIGCVGSATYSLLPALSRRLADELPRVDFSFRGEMLVPEQVVALRAGEIDLALLRPPIADLSLTLSPLRQERLVVVIPVDHPLSRRRHVRVGDLRNQALIAHSADRRSMMYGLVLKLFRDAGLEPQIRHEVGETSTLITLVAGGLGVAIVPEPVTAMELRGVTYRPLRHPEASIELSLAHRADDSQAHLHRTIEVVRSLVANGAVVGDGSDRPVRE